MWKGLLEIYADVSSKQAVKVKEEIAIGLLELLRGMEVQLNWVEAMMGLLVWSRAFLELVDSFNDSFLRMGAPRIIL